MTKRISMVGAGIVIVVLSGVVSASAQEKTSWFSNPFTVSSGSESIPTPGSGSTMEMVTMVTPSRFSMDGASARSRWGFGYQPEFEFRFGPGRQYSWNHSADARFGHQFSRRTKLDFGNSFVKSSDPARIFADNIFVMPQDNFRENASSVTLSREASARTTVNFRFDNTFTRMGSVGDANTAILNQYGVAGTAGLSQRVGARQKLTISYSVLKFSPYRFDTAVGAAQFAANIPIVQAGIARFGAALAESVSRSSPTPTGMASGGQGTTSSPAPNPSNSSSASPGVTVGGDVSVAGQQVGVSLPTGTVSGGSTATVTVAPTPAPTVSIAPSPAPTIAVTPSLPAVSASVPVPSVPTVTVAPAPSVPVSAPIVVASPVVPLVPTVTAPVLDPTLPLVGVVTPLPSTSSTPSTSCDLVQLNNTCSTTTNVTTSPGVPSAPLPTSTITKLSVAPGGRATAVPAETSTAAPAAPADPTVSNPDGTGTKPQLLGDPFHVVSVTYTYTKDPGLLFEMSGGVMRDREMSYLMGMQVERRFDRVWIAGGFQRFLSFFGTLPFQGAPPAGVVMLPNGVRARSVFSALTARAGGKINQKTQLEMSASISNSSANFVAQDVKSVIARARLSYWISDRVGVFADVDSFYQGSDETSAGRFSRQRYFGGLMMRLTPPRGAAQMAGN